MPRKRRGWPMLKRLDIRRLVRRPGTPDVIRKLLEPQELDVLEEIRSVSDISDVFAEFHQNSFFARKKGRKRLSKYEADVLTMDQFTEDFKNTMEETKNELQIEKNMINEDIDTIEKVIKTPRKRKDLPEYLKEEIRKLLEETENIPLDATQDTKVLKKSEEQDLGYDYMSGVWCMLDAHCKNTKFTVSPMNFDVFNQSPRHWLQRPDISQQAIEDSKLKCQVWLNKHYA